MKLEMIFTTKDGLMKY